MDAEDLKTIYIALAASLLTSAMLPFLYIRRFVLRWQHRHESITVTPEEFRYEDTQTGHVTAVPWSEVTDYFYSYGTAFSGSRYTLVLSGADERQISWNPLLDIRHRLLAIVQEYAPPPANHTAAASAWRSKSEHEKTGGSDLSTWKSGAVGIGGRVFRYGTRMLGILLVVGVVASVPLTVLCISEWLKPVPKDKWIALGMTLLFVVPTIGGVLCYLFSRVETDDMGITQFSVFGKKHLYWYAVADYRINKPKSRSLSESTTVRGHNGTRIVCWKEINGYEELKQEIARYAPSQNQNDKTSDVTPE